ncbi:flagellin [Mesorhizobium sp. 1B3]|uniref:flagellin N-terminal helical domain-containing protein n=1 Tax=Mesorhizobium sp. 1B3 TaxID=3243599 RepID=UPI003D992A27
MVDMAYSAMDKTIGVVDRIKARLTAATSDGIDLPALQTEISNLVENTVQIAQSANFAGVNWLSTDVPDILETEEKARWQQLTTSFTRGADGQVRIGSLPVDLQKTSLYNMDGGGILQGDPRSPGTIGGIRLPDAGGGYTTYNQRSGSRASRDFVFSGPLVFADANDRISFDITVDADNPDPATNGGLPGPYGGGSATTTVTIDRALVDSVFPNNGGIVSTYREMVQVLSAALAGTGASAVTLRHYVDDRLVEIPNAFRIHTSETSGLDGSHVSVTGFTSNVGSGGLADFTSYGQRGSSLTLTFSPFQVYRDVEIGFDFSINGVPSGSGLITRTLVDTLLGKDDGRVETEDETAALLEHLIGQPGLVIETTGGGITLRTDAVTDRLNGAKTGIGFSGIAVNIEPLPAIGLSEIDIVANPHMIRSYLETVDAMLLKLASGAAELGAIASALDMRKDFTETLRQAVARGVGQLVDADMESASARLQALKGPPLGAGGPSKSVRKRGFYQP